MTRVVYLIVSTDGEIKLTKKHRPAAGEIAYKVSVNLPNNWGMIAGNITIDVPEFDYPVDLELVPSEAKLAEVGAA